MAGQPFAFGPFVLDPETGTLLRQGVPVPVGYRGLLLLAALLERPGEVLTKSELMDAAWPGTAVEEGNLSVQIASLRKLLGPSADGSDWIATVPRVGYRFAGRPPRRRGPATAEDGSRPTRPLDRRPALRQSQRRSGAGLFRRRPRRGHHHAAVAPALAVRLGAQLLLHLQGQGGRREAGRARARRPLRARRQRPALRPAAADQRRS